MSRHFSRRKIVSGLTVAAMGLVLFQFQNCAPPGKSEAAGVGGTNGDDVRLADDLNKTEIQFASVETEIEDSAESTGVAGLCNRDHNGAKLTWSVWDSDSGKQALAGGVSTCRGGQFSVPLDQLDQFVCGLPHLLVVEGDWGGSTHTYFSRRCQPLAAEIIQVPGQPAGTQCQLEYSAASDSGASCAQVCYRDKKVVSEFNVANSQCANLAGQLASH